MTKFVSRCLIFLKVPALFYIKKVAMPVRDGVQPTSFPLCSISYSSVNVLSAKFYQLIDRTRLKIVSWLLTILTIVFIAFIAYFYTSFTNSSYIIYLLVPTASMASIVVLKTSTNFNSISTSDVPEEKWTASAQPAAVEARQWTAAEIVQLVLWCTLVGVNWLIWAFLIFTCVHIALYFLYFLACITISGVIHGLWDHAPISELYAGMFDRYVTYPIAGNEELTLSGHLQMFVWPFFHLYFMGSLLSLLFLSTILGPIAGFGFKLLKFLSGVAYTVLDILALPVTGLNHLLQQRLGETLPFVSYCLLFVLVPLFKIVCVLIAVAYYTLAERKIMASVQRRLGPNVVGLWGLLQPLADGLKLFGKEFIVPSHANSTIFILAPMGVLGCAFLACQVIPFHVFDNSENLSIVDMLDLLAIDAWQEETY
jgi:hypothetical protein